MGGLVGKLGNFDKTIINVFTISTYIRRMAMTNRSRAFRENVVSKIREEEDREFCERYGIKQINLGLSESSEENYSHSEFVRNLSEKIKSHIDPAEKCLIFFPLGIGGHINHLQVFDACKLLIEVYGDGEFILYEDLPYGHRIASRFVRIDRLSEFLSSYGFVNCLNILSKKDILQKRKDIMLYESQHKYRHLCTVKIHRYFTRTSLLGYPYEGFWVREGTSSEISKFLTKNSHSLVSALRRFFHLF
jgi:hypothetical protein